MRRKLINSRWKIIVIISSIFLTLNTVVFGVPLNMSYSNQKNVKSEHFTQEKERDDKQITDSSCIVNGSTYEKGKHVPGAGPCEECICQPPNVVCSMMKCPINSGCITIQLPNKCCPKYKCDCEHKGKLYNNGEKINKSDESACRVCFCNGGEIVCTSIVCYTRSDCQGYYLPGDCCPKYDNCSSISIEKKPRELIYNDKLSTGLNYNEDNIWKRDTTQIQKQELSTVSNIITMQSIFVDTENILKKKNISILNDLFKELEGTTLSPILNENVTLKEYDNEINIPHNYNFSTEITVGNLNTMENLNTSFLGFKTDNLTINEEIKDFSINNETSKIIPEFSDLFDTIDIDNSVVVTHQNGTETIIGITEIPSTEEIIYSTIEPTTNSQVDILDPSDFILDSKRPMIEFSTISSELDTTDMDYEESREPTTPRTPNKLKIGTPHKLVMISPQKTIEEELNTDIAFIYSKDTTNILKPNFEHSSYNTETYESLTNSDTVNQEINYTTLLPTILTSYENISEITSESLQKELFNESFINYSNIKNIDANTSTTIEYGPENISVAINEATEIYNDTNFLELESINITSCVNNSCTNNSKLNDELYDSQIESTSTTPFIIEKKVLTNKASSPHLVIKKMQYPKEYPDEFETIQNGPSLTITKKTYTSIPDIVYTTTTMVTLPTLDLIYKANEEMIEKYLVEIQSTTIKPSNNLSPLRNVSSFP